MAATNEQAYGSGGERDKPSTGLFSPLLLGAGITLAAILTVFSCDFGDDDNKDIDEVACDKNCLDDGLNDSADCLDEYVDCLEDSGNETFCLIGAASCLNGALDRECFCANGCNGCMEDFCDCAQGCSAYDLECVESCFPVLFGCADWIDQACYESCGAQVDSCFSSCMSDQDYEDCHACVDIYENCYKGCY